jgi:transketolase
MGDQIGVAVTGEMYFVEIDQFKLVLESELEQCKKIELFASLARINALYMIAKAGSGHIGSSFSSMDIISSIYINEIYSNAQQANSNNIFFSSKGHDSPAIYSALIGLGRLDFDMLHKLRRIDGLPGHPDISTPNIVTNTGSLGMGISKAKGMIFANRQNNIQSNVFVLTGDGELQEGQFWESLISATNHDLHELVVIIDHNKLQSDTLVDKVSALGDLESKLKSFHWNVFRCNGNDIEQLEDNIAQAKTSTKHPNIIIADTIKGKGVSFMEHTSIDSDTEFYKFHSGAPTSDLYLDAVQELITSSNQMLSDSGLPALEVEQVSQVSAKVPQKNTQSLISAYSDELVKLGGDNHNIVALDADLMIDTGLLEFSRKYPDRFIECGIAEQDMVSQAGGLALKKFLPIVHSFACFLSTRANEQIYNNATELTKIIYVGSLAGMIPAGPGHSHQSVRDISSFGSIPKMVMMEPSSELEVKLLLNWAVNKNTLSSYLRLTSVPWPINFELPDGYVPELGRGVQICKGSQFVIFAYGPIMLSLACDVSEYAKESLQMEIKVINLPWLNNIDADWFVEELNDAELVVSLDNHYLDGGQGSRIADLIANNQLNLKFHNFGLDEIPACGTPQEVLEYHGFTLKKIFQFFEDSIV